METYGVTFENFQSDWGLEYYRRIEQEAVPECKAVLQERERVLKRAKAGLDRLLTAKAAVKSLIRSADELDPLVSAVSNGDAVSLHDLLACSDLDQGNPEDVERKEALSRVEKWIVQTKTCRSDIDLLFCFAQEVAEYKIQVCERQVREWRAMCEFYEKSVEAQRGGYVFDHAEKRYKTRICRDMIKLLSEVVRLGDVVRNTIAKDGDGEVDENTSVAGLYDDATHMLKFYREFKSLVADVGIDNACDMIVKRKHTHDIDGVRGEAP